MKVEKDRKNQEKYAKGVTLIALVVTVIILLILAGISIYMATKDNGLIENTNDAKVKTEISAYREELEVIHIDELSKLKNYETQTFLERYAEAVKKDAMFKNAQEVSIDETNEIVIVVTEEGYRFEISADSVTYVGGEEGTPDIDISDVTIGISVQPTSWTNGKVTVKITSNVSSVTKQYSLDQGKTWENYTNPIEIDDNGTVVQAKAMNQSNEETRVVTEKIENIDRLKPEIQTPRVTGIEGGIIVEASATDKEATQTDGKSGIKGYQFSSNNGVDWTETKTSGTYTFTGLKGETTYTIKVKAIDNARNEVQSGAVSGKPIVEIPSAKDKVQFTQTPNNWTNKSITVTMEGPDGYTIEYSVDGGNYQDYTTGVVMEQNGTIKVRLKKNGTTGEETTYIVDKIDKLPPKDFEPNIQKTTTNAITVVAKAEDAEADGKNGSSGIKGYQFSKDNGANWSEMQTDGTYTFEDLTAGQTYQIVVKVTDNAENEKEAKISDVGTTSIPSGESSITIKKNPASGWTKGPVKVTIEQNVEGYILQYSYDNKVWVDYKGELTVENNGQYIYARLSDGKTGGTAKREQVTNIDRLSPNTFTPDVQTTTTTVTIIANTTDKQATQTDGMSGIRGYQYSINNGASWTEEISNNTYTFTGLSQGQSYQAKVKVIDKAGNETESSVVRGDTTEIPGALGNIIVEKSESDWTKKPVNVTLRTELSGYHIQYAINDASSSSWKTYTQPIQVEDNNTIIYARLVNDNGEMGSPITETIKNIDRLSPKNVTIQVVEKATSSITIRSSAEDADATNIDGKSDIAGYQFYIEGQGWIGEQTSGEYTFIGLKSDTQYLVKVKAIDNAGNEKESEIQYVTTEQLPNPADTIRINKNPSSGWTKDPVQVTIDKVGQLDGYSLQYSRDNSVWMTYLGNTITVENNNETIYARLYDLNSEEATASINTKITNIDKLSPNKFTPQVTTKVDQITITASGVTDQVATQTSGSSGIRGYKFYLEGRGWSAEQTSNVKTYTSLVPATSYEIKVIAIDQAGNEMESYATTGTTQSDVDSSDIIISQSPATGWTNQSVYITITNLSNYDLEYSLYNQNNWRTYTGQVEMTTNGTIYARLVNDAGSTLATNSRSISNIDKDNPYGSYSTDPSYGIVASEVTINLTLYDTASGPDYSSIICTQGNVTKLSNTSYKVTENGIYTFTFRDNAGNQGSVNVEVLNIEQKKLRVGDYVEYVPNGQQSITLTEEYLGIVQTVSVEDLDWRVFDIKEDGTVDLISTITDGRLKARTNKVYNNIVYTLNTIGQKLYGNSNIGATARSIKLEDLLDKFNPDYDYVANRTLIDELIGIYGASYTVNGPVYMPSMWMQEKGQYNTFEGKPTGGTLGISEQDNLVDGYVYTASSITYTNGYLRLKSDYKNNMKSVETKENDNDTGIYGELFLYGSYLYASRATIYDTHNDLGLGYYYCNGSLAIAQVGWYPSSDMQEGSATTNFYQGLRFIVTLPASSINLEQGNGEEGNGWGIQ